MLGAPPKPVPRTIAPTIAGDAKVMERDPSGNRKPAPTGRSDRCRRRDALRPLADRLPPYRWRAYRAVQLAVRAPPWRPVPAPYRGYRSRSEEHTSELQSLMRISYAVL